jgi:hypothetical protein
MALGGPEPYSHQQTRRPEKRREAIIRKDVLRLVEGRALILVIAALAVASLFFARPAHADTFTYRAVVLVVGGRMALFQLLDHATDI